MAKCYRSTSCQWRKSQVHPLVARFTPNGEAKTPSGCTIHVSSFRHCLDVGLIADTDDVKPDCTLVYIDFFLRHGFIQPDSPGYLELLNGLRGFVHLPSKV